MLQKDEGGKALFGNVTFVEAEGAENEVGFVTGVMKEADFEAKKEQSGRSSLT